MSFAILGFTLIALPFVFLFALIWKESGLKTSLLIFGFAGFVIGLLYLGSYFLHLAGILK